jgi:hypothetical protein
MNLATRYCLILAAVLGLLLTPSASQEQTKFRGVAFIELPKACGNGLDQNSPCGSCVRVVAPAVTKYASCAHACVKLPDRLGPNDVIVIASGAEGSNTVTGTYKKCGNGNVNDPCNGYDRYEGTEWYKDMHMICGRFKNWSNDRDRVYSIQVIEK